MSLTAPAPSMQPDPTEINLLTSADPLPAAVAGYDRWRTGLAQRSTYTVPVGTWPVDCVSEDEKAALNTDDSNVIEFLPVSLYSHHGCAGRVDIASYRAEALSRIEQATPYLLAQELWTGAVSGNPSLQSTAYDLTGVIGGGTMSVVEGSIALIGYFEAMTAGAKATLHVPQVGMFELVDAMFANRQGNRFVTANGHTIIPGPGYPMSAGDWGPAESDPADQGELYLYVTGQVEVGLHTIVTLGSENNPGGQYARQNLVEFYAERLAIYRFPQVVGAIKVQTSWYSA